MGGEVGGGGGGVVGGRGKPPNMLIHSGHWTFLSVLSYIPRAAHYNIVHEKEEVSGGMAVGICEEANI